ncbi:MAG TPA: OmpA family protein [Blastocatellia bacterium]|nr:OmpA family protein [Blastocatellia bacterium]
MIYRILAGVIVLAMGVAMETGCATKKYVRNRISERVQPLENRTGELEETSRRNSQQISQLNDDLTDVRTKAGRAQDTADRAASSAEQANTRVAQVETDVEDIRNNLDKYTLRNTQMVFFRPGSARLSPEAMAQLDQLAEQVGTMKGYVLEIVGYPDTVRTRRLTRYNEQLAGQRAEAVQRYLADKDNLPVMRMFALGFGAGRPPAQNAAMDNQSASLGEGTVSRRVDIRVLTNAAANGSTGEKSRTASASRSGQ